MHVLTKLREVLPWGLLRALNIEVSREHDVSAALEERRAQLPEVINTSLEEITDISQNLRRNRELAFYGGEDGTPPHEFYKRKHALSARTQSERIVELCLKVVMIEPRGRRCRISKYSYSPFRATIRPYNNKRK